MDCTASKANIISASLMRNCIFKVFLKAFFVFQMLDMLIPEQTVLSSQQITIGKIYAAKLIYESFKEIKRRKNCTLPQFAVSLFLVSFFVVVVVVVGMN